MAGAFRVLLPLFEGAARAGQAAGRAGVSVAAGAEGVGAGIEAVRGLADRFTTPLHRRRRGLKSRGRHATPKRYGRAAAARRGARSRTLFSRRGIHTGIRRAAMSSALRRAGFTRYVRRWRGRRRASLRSRTTLGGRSRRGAATIKPYRTRRLLSAKAFIPGRIRVKLTNTYSFSGVPVPAGTVDTYGAGIGLVADTHANVLLNNPNYFRYSTFAPLHLNGTPGGVQPVGHDTMFNNYERLYLLKATVRVQLLRCDMPVVFAGVWGVADEPLHPERYYKFYASNYKRDYFLPPYNNVRANDKCNRVWKLVMPNTENLRLNTNVITFTVDAARMNGMSKSRYVNGGRGTLQVEAAYGHLFELTDRDAEFSNEGDTIGIGTTVNRPFFNVMAMAAEKTTDTAANLSYRVTVDYEVLMTRSFDISTT